MLKNLFAVMAMIAGLPLFLPPAAAETSDHIGQGKFAPVRLTCPGDNGGTFELISKNIKGETQKLQAHYRMIDGQGEKAVGIDVYKIHEPGGPAELEATIDLLRDNNEADTITAGKALKVTDAIMEKVCNGSEESKQKFHRWLRTNAERFSH